MEWISEYIKWDKIWESEVDLSIPEGYEFKCYMVVNQFLQDGGLELLESECGITENQQLLFCWSERGGQNESDTQGWSREYYFVVDSDFFVVSAEYEQG